MSCYYPLPASRARESGRVTVGYHPRDTWTGDRLELPCGGCVGCKMDRARSWSTRIMHEAQLYDSNLFVTLDYAPEHLPKSLSLEYVDFQLFMKRLRRHLRGVCAGPNGCYPIRFFVSGEYGEKYQRPHWHAILFNTRFPDQVSYLNGTLRSTVAEKLWNMGNVVIGSVTPQSASYCAGYTLYKQKAVEYEDVVNLATGEVSMRRPPFCQMSRDPGIGSWWYERYASDVLPADVAVVDGKRGKVPRYYYEKYKAEAAALDVEAVADARCERARARPIEESSERRREDRAMVAKARLKFFSQRSL